MSQKDYFGTPGGESAGFAEPAGAGGTRGAGKAADDLAGYQGGAGKNARTVEFMVVSNLMT